VYAFTLRDGDSYARVLSLGGILQSLVVPDKEGIMTDIVLGYDTPQEYWENDGYLGALIGRFGNRIADGRLEIDGTVYALNCNNGANHLHGGAVGFDKKIWDCEVVKNEETGDEELHLSYLSPDGEENYPGSLETKGIYAFSGGELFITYYAISDKKTAINMTNHAYFNLDGDGKKNSTLDFELQINAE
jgi:aldose 1-epimerase